MAAALTAGLVSQAFINIGYVVGLLPVTGIQLPLLSAGGTSAIITLAGMGVLASVARHEPEAISAMQNRGRPTFDRLFGISEPRTPTQERKRTPRAARPGRRTPRTLSASEREQRFGTRVPASNASRPDSARRLERTRYDDPRRSTRSGYRRVG